MRPLFSGKQELSELDYYFQDGGKTGAQTNQSFWKLKIIFWWSKVSHIIIKGWNFMIKSFSGLVVFCFAFLRTISAYVGENWLSQYITSGLNGKDIRNTQIGGTPTFLEWDSHFYQWDSYFLPDGSPELLFSKSKWELWLGNEALVPHVILQITTVRDDIDLWRSVWTRLYKGWIADTQHNMSEKSLTGKKEPKSNKKSRGESVSVRIVYICLQKTIYRYISKEKVNNFQFFLSLHKKIFWVLCQRGKLV